MARIAEQMRETKRINVAREKTKRGNSDKIDKISGFEHDKSIYLE